MCRSSGQLVYVSVTHYTGSPRDIISVCPELTPYQPVIEPLLPAGIVLTGERNEISLIYRGPDPSLFESQRRGLNAGIPGGGHYASDPSTCCCNQMHMGNPNRMRTHRREDSD